MSKIEKIIEVKDLQVAYGDKIILDRVSLEIDSGELTAILGPNGSGKSTLIKAILGLVPITKGDIKVFGKKSHEVLDKIGYLPQRFTFDSTFPMTVEELLELSLHGGMPVTNIDDKLAEVDLLGKKKALVGELSGGELQRVLIARAILNNPKLLILDEPEAGIDVGAERNFYTLIKHLDENHGITVLFISHEVDLVYDFAEQVICLNKALVCRGVPRKVLTPEKLEELYAGGLLHHQHRHKERPGEETHHIEEHGRGAHKHGKQRHH